MQMAGGQSPQNLVQGVTLNSLFRNKQDYKRRGGGTMEYLTIILLILIVILYTIITIKKD